MERGWKYRRLMVFTIIISCLGMLFAALMIGGNDMVVLAVVQAALGIIIVVAGGYLGFASWDDKNKAREILDGIRREGQP